MITKEQIEDWESSEQYYDPYENQRFDPYDDAPPVDDLIEYIWGNTVMTPFDMVKQFAEITGQNPTPSLYVKLIGEEFDEWTKEGMIKSEEDLKELADLIYVLYGYANAMGYKIDEAIKRVHENNVGRCVQEDGSVKKREDGKIIKNKAYPSVYLKDLL